MELKSITFNPAFWPTRQRFNPAVWLPVPVSAKPEKQIKSKNDKLCPWDETHIVVERIEAARIDLTLNYFDWLKLGFAFASEFGESGRGYFHRVSRFHPGYNQKETDNQFDKCLKRGKHGAGIKSFFFMAHEAGINVKI